MVGIKDNFCASSRSTKQSLGQTEAVTMVLLSGVVVSLVGAAYFWGVPMIDKRAASTDFTVAANQLKDINSKIISLANAGGGRVEIDLSKPITLVPAGADDPDNNSLVSTFGVKQPIIYPGTTGSVIYLGATNFGDIDEESGVFGQSSPSIMTMVQSTSAEVGFVMTSRIKYRPLYTTTPPIKFFEIELCGDTDLVSCDNQVTGTSKLILTFRGTETIHETSERVVTKIGVTLT